MYWIIYSEMLGKNGTTYRSYFEDHLITGLGKVAMMTFDIAKAKKYYVKQQAADLKRGRKGWKILLVRK
jgi:hypothetical protein